MIFCISLFSICNRADWDLVACHPSIWYNNLCWWKQVFINRAPTLRAVRALQLWALLSHKTQKFSCSPKDHKPKPCLEVLHFLICPSASHVNKSPSFLECALMGFRVVIFLEQLSSSGSGVCCSQFPCGSPGTMCCVTLVHSVLKSGAQEGTCFRVGLCL